MLVSEKKLFDAIDSHHIDAVKNSYIIYHDNKLISIYRDRVCISNDAIVLINQQHDGHLFTYAEDAYKRQELKDFL